MMPIQEVWYVAREYAGIAEAGGVKNVSCSLAEGMAAQGYSVTVHSAYGCVTISGELLSGCREAIRRIPFDLFKRPALTAFA